MKKIVMLIILFVMSLILSGNSHAQVPKASTEFQLLSKVDMVVTKMSDNFETLVLDIKNIKESLAALKTDFTVMQNDYMTFKKNDWPIISNKVDNYVLKQSLLENEVYNIKTTAFPEIKNRVDNLEKNLDIRDNESSKTDVTLNIVLSILGAIGTVLLAFFIKNRSEKQ